MKQGADCEQRWEIRVAVVLEDNRKIDELISRTLKEAGYLFMYSGEPKSIFQHLEEASVFDQQAVDLSQQVNSDMPIAFAVIRLISSTEQHKIAADYLHINHIENIKPFDRQLDQLQKKTVPNELLDVLFGQANKPDSTSPDTELDQTTASFLVNSNQPLKTYAVIDASKLKVFDGSHFLDGLPCKSLYTGEASRLYERLSPYLIELELDHDFTRRLFTQAENEDQQPWYFYQQSAGIFIRSHLGIEALFKHLRKFTRIWNPQSATWFQYRFFEADWLEDMLLCMTPGQLRKFWNAAFDQIIAIKPLEGSVAVISVKASLQQVKAEKLEMTKNYEEGLAACQEDRFVEKLLDTCAKDMSQYTPVAKDAEKQFIKDLLVKGYAFGFKSEKEVLYYIISAWITAKEHPNWLEAKLTALTGAGSPYEISLSLFESACELKRI